MSELLLVYVQTSAYEGEALISARVSQYDSVKDIKIALLPLFCNIHPRRFHYFKQKTIQTCQLLLKSRGICLEDEKTIEEYKITDQSELILLFDLPLLTSFTSVVTATNDFSTRVPFVVWSVSKHSFWLIYGTQLRRTNVKITDYNAAQKAAACVEYEPVDDDQSICSSSDWIWPYNETMNVFVQFLSRETNRIETRAIRINTEEWVADIQMRIKALTTYSLLYRRTSFRPIFTERQSLQEMILEDNLELFAANELVIFDSSVEDILQNPHPIGSVLHVSKLDPLVVLVHEIPSVNNAGVLGVMKKSVELLPLTIEEKISALAAMQPPPPEYRTTSMHQLFFSDHNGMNTVPVLQRRELLQEAINELMQRKAEVREVLYPCTMICRKCPQAKGCPKVYADAQSVCPHCPHQLQYHGGVGTKSEMKALYQGEVRQIERAQEVVKTARRKLGIRNYVWRDELLALREVNFPLTCEVGLLKLVAMYCRGDGCWFWEQIAGDEEDVPIELFADNFATVFVDQVPIAEAHALVNFVITEQGAKDQLKGLRTVSKEQFTRFVTRFAPFETCARTATNLLLRYYKRGLFSDFHVEPCLSYQGFKTPPVDLEINQYCFRLSSPTECLNPCLILQTSQQNHHLHRSGDGWVCDPLDIGDDAPVFDLMEALHEQPRPAPYFHSITITDVHGTHCCIPVAPPSHPKTLRTRYDGAHEVVYCVSTTERKACLGGDVFYSEEI